MFADELTLCNGVPTFEHGKPTGWACCFRSHRPTLLVLKARHHTLCAAPDHSRTARSTRQTNPSHVSQAPPRPTGQEPPCHWGCGQRAARVSAAWQCGGRLECDRSSGVSPAAERARDGRIGYHEDAADLLKGLKAATGCVLRGKVLLPLAEAASIWLGSEEDKDKVS
eukprot:SAG11_NODE_2984_length_2791_cov_1.161961_2_plen_168_part_00